MATQIHHPPNPLRPYVAPDATPPYSTPPPAGPSLQATAPAPGSIVGTKTAVQAYGALSENLQDVSDYLESNPSFSESINAFINQAALRYTTVLIAQPFEVAKTVLQCQYVPKQNSKPKQQQKRWQEEKYEDSYDENSEDSDDDEPNYFSTSNISAQEPSSLRPSRKMRDQAGYVLEDQEDPDIARPDYQLRCIRHGAIGDTLKALWNKEGAWGIWKGQNATFIYTIASQTLEAWTGSLLSAIFALPDPGITEIADSTHPMASLGIAVAAAAFTAIALSPLDIIRTKLILTPASSRPRGLLAALRTLSSYTVPSPLIIPTTLNAVLPTLVSVGSPYFIRTRLFLDPVLHPTAWSFCGFLASAAELIVKLPIETVLRRAQLAAAKPERTIVPVGRYAGVIGTAWVIVREEESGKWGFEGLYRGWRVGAWSNVGVLGLGFVGIQQSGEF